MALLGAGTKSSPIAIDDSEDEVVYELSKDISMRSSPSSDKPDENEKHTHPGNVFDQLTARSETSRDRKRKRAGSMTSQDIPVAGPSRPKQRNHPSLVNRLSQPESKKARKRRRKAERQAQEDARLRNINYEWLNKTGPPPPLHPHSSWSLEHHAYVDPSYTLGQPSLGLSMPLTDGLYPRSYLSYNSSNPYQEEAFYDNYDSHSVTPPSNSLPSTPSLPPSITSDWVSAMAMAADSSTNAKDVDNQPSHWSPISTQVSLPPMQPPPLPPPLPTHSAPPPPPPPKATPILPKPVEHHALPQKPLPLSKPLPHSKPPPSSKPLPPSKPLPHPPIAHIGMQPDKDPNSKHGSFHITAATKDVGSNAKKKKKDHYIPNPARTLVMEQLPKTHRQPEFITKWSRSACGALPVHLFIDGPKGKALIEFATAELARKAWSSPKLGLANVNLKPHQLKGKPREDLIKVWWYRVEGVGAGAGVGEIEEGEIEGDTVEKEPEVAVPKKETKKERKARLAKEREEKRLVREAAELKAAQARQAQLQPPPPPPPGPVIADQLAPSISQQVAPHHVPVASSSTLRRPVTLNNDFSRYQTALHSSARSSGTIPPFNQSWAQSYSNPPVNKAAYGASEFLRPQDDDNESIASSATSSSTSPMEAGQVDDLDDYEEADMDVDIEDVVAPPPPKPQPPPPQLMHKSLPPRPMSPIRNSRSSAQKAPPQPQTQFSASATPFVPRSSVQQASSLQRRTLPLPQLPANVSKPESTRVHVVQQLRPQHSVTTPTGQPFVSVSLPTVSATLSPSLSVSSASSSVPSEPKAMKNAPTEPSFAKRALMARQKELEEKIAQTKLELAAASATKSPAIQAVVQASQATVSKTTVDQEEKQAREDRLRQLVMQSQRAKAKVVPKIVAPSDPQTTVKPSTPPAPTTHPEKPMTTTATTLSSSSISVSSQSKDEFSLEDLAVSFITQTIETVKSQSSSVKTTPAPAAASILSHPIKPSPSYSHVKSDLAAKQIRLEEHILETKKLMARLSQCRSKEEKEVILKIMREKERIYLAEEEKAASSSASSSISSAPTSSSLTATKWNTASGSVVNKPQATTSQQVHITRWPISQQDSGVLMISDDEDDDENEDDEDEDDAS